jgi:hypothetical protein
MADATVEWFGRLAQRRHEPLLEKYTGRLRFDLTQGEQTDHYLLTIQ